MWSPSLWLCFHNHLLSIFATTTSSVPKLHIANFCISLQVLCIFALHYSFGSPVPWLSPNRGLAILMPGVAYALIRSRHTLCLSGSLPPRFWHRKSYFRHFNNGLLTFNSSTHTIRHLVIQLTDYAFTLSLSTNSWRVSTTRRFDKYAWTALPIVHFMNPIYQYSQSVRLTSAIELTFFHKDLSSQSKFCFHFKELS